MNIQSPRDVVVDILNTCPCCERYRVDWHTFLTEYIDEANVPATFDTQSLRVHIRLTGNATSDDAGLGTLLSYLARTGIVVVERDEFLVPGVVTRRCLAGH